MSNGTDAHDPSVGEDADTSPAKLGRTRQKHSHHSVVSFSDLPAG
jgi:hypothetical protein